MKHYLFSSYGYFHLDINFRFSFIPLLQIILHLLLVDFSGSVSSNHQTSEKLISSSTLDLLNRIILPFHRYSDDFSSPRFQYYRLKFIFHLHLPYLHHHHLVAQDLLLRITTRIHLHLKSLHLPQYLFFAEFLENLHFLSLCLALFCLPSHGIHPIGLYKHRIIS